MKITLIGRPGKIDVRKDLVITTMTHTAGAPTFPRGVPRPPETPTVYTVYMAVKQWRQAEAAIQENADDVLIIEGMCAFDPELQAVAVYSTKVTTKGIEAKKRGATTTNGKAETAPAETKAAAPAPVEPIAETPAPEPVIPAAAPANVAQKLRELHSAAELYRQKIASLESKPAGQRFGLEMTQKLLKNVEDEISSLHAQYA